MTSKRDKLTAVLITALIAALTLALLLFTELSPAAARQPAPPLQEEIFYEVMELPEQKVITKAVAAPEESSGLDVADAGESDAAPVPLAAPTPQPENAQVQQHQEETEAPGANNSEEPAKPQRRPGAKPPTSGAFAGTEGTSNSTGDSPYAIPGRGILRKPTTVIRTTSAQSGWVDVDITVTPQGKVVKAEVTGSSGFGSEEDAIREKARRLLLTELQYSADDKAPTRTYTKRVTISPAKK